MSQEREHYINSVNLNIDTDFPYLVLDVVNDTSLPRNPGFQVMHWHEDLQFIYVLHGDIEVHTLDDVVPLHKGEGIFINANVVHDVRRTGECHYNSFIFPAYFLEFYAGGPAQESVRSIIDDDGLPLIRFTPTIDWHRDILAQLRRLSRIERSHTPHRPYAILVRLVSVWLTLITNRTASNNVHSRKDDRTKQRMRTMLRYIDEHYAYDLTLDDVARSADISKSECFRCFKTSLGTTPYRYITEFRLSQAAKLLADTDSPITAIARAVGFRQLSHFGKCFKEKTGHAPREYREHHHSRA